MHFKTLNLFSRSCIAGGMAHHWVKTGSVISNATLHSSHPESFQFLISFCTYMYYLLLTKNNEHLIYGAYTNIYR